jgi:hypothetical protein
LGTSDVEDEEAAAEEDGVVEGFVSCRRALNVEMNSIDCGDSPSRLLKCSAASCFDNVEA